MKSIIVLGVVLAFVASSYGGSDNPDAVLALQNVKDSVLVVIVEGQLKAAVETTDTVTINNLYKQLLKGKKYDTSLVEFTAKEKTNTINKVVTAKKLDGKNHVILFYEKELGYVGLAEIVFKLLGTVGLLAKGLLTELYKLVG
uniref:Uncharacterized protein n=1 Tax=Musca domestica TaxID=7370 RepID=T1PHA4_MUSDO